MQTSSLTKVSELNLKDCSCTCLLIMGDTLVISTTIGTLLQFSLRTMSLELASQTSMNKIDCMAKIDDKYFAIAGLKIEIWQIPLTFDQIYKAFAEESAIGISIVDNYMYIAMEESGVHKVNLVNPFQETLYTHSSFLIAFDLLNLNSKISIASVSINDELIVYEDLEKKKKFDERLCTIKFEQNGNYVICGAVSGKIHFFSVEKNQIITSIEAHDARVKSIAVGKTQKIFVTGSFDQTAKVYFMNELEPVEIISEHCDRVQSVAISESFKVIITGSADNMIKFWGYSSLVPERESRSRIFNFLCSLWTF